MRLYLRDAAMLQLKNNDDSNGIRRLVSVIYFHKL